ncbi:16S rRNA (cytosine(967)-C(5))-methyltransferase [Rhodopirellula islandica]|uniref:16S rRNA (Cytosine(967)-C(5))-methyltransferase n=1 Tax=Rhodopirellula islandica TaxID=595434 RepID=A0A0J1EAI6_RHOIS|nr:SAM-dependent methyltransferase [Rhodopirellula islandica]KLU02629.1 16S rRNA (cytosine(967)-C(5))-methyltransferase [Rhodopirellula islandica]
MSRSRKGSKKASRKSQASSKPSANRKPVALTAEQVSSAIDPIELPDAELEHLAAAMSQRHANVMRVRRDRAPTFRLQPSSSGSDSRTDVPWYPLAVSIPDGFHASRSIDFAAGEFYLQDAGSLLALAAAEAHTGSLAGQLVCDLCAAPGGKATGLLEAIGDDGFLLANEPIRSRIAPLAYNLSRTGSDRYAISCEDPDALAEKLPGVFDTILIDAPCSGQALLSRGRQSKGAVNESMVATNAARQQRILAAAHLLLRPGGTIVYSTCTFAVAENEDQVDWMTRELGMQPSPVAALCDYQSSLTECGYRVWPHRDGCAGAFAARVKKPGDVDASEDSVEFVEDPWLLRRGVLQSEQPLDPACDEVLQSVLGAFPENSTDKDSGLLRQRDWIAEAFCKGAPEWVKQAWTIGPEVAYRTGQTWKPSHACALRHVDDEFAKGAGRIDLDDAQAATYLSGGTIPTDRRGWQIVQHLGRPLGWVKADGRIGKNHLPTHARMQVSPTNG